MAPENRPKRKYNSTRRQEQARNTRQQIVAAARRLFPEFGYAGTTIEALAQEAGVAPETIFASFGSKRGVLERLVDFSVGGDDQPIPLMQRPGPQAVQREPDPVRQIQSFASDITMILERIAPVFEVLRMAAKTEPDIADLLNKLLDERLQNLSVFVQRLAEHSPLRPGLDELQAAEVVWGLTSPELYRLFTVDRDWSQERYAQWLAAALIRLLLP
ncbi:MAG: TetR/AcrR family transcriptional regulator [Anaerolineales bacterium]|jgi:AcrR family transcriptional regulator